MPKLSELIKRMGEDSKTPCTITDAYSKAVEEGLWDDHSHDDGHYHPSQIAGCPALLFLAMEKFPLPKDVPYARPGELPDYGKMTRIFKNGDGTHERIQGDLCDMGYLDVSALDETQETPMSIPELNIIGHCDGVLNFGKRTLVKNRKNKNPFVMFGKVRKLWRHLDNKDRAVLEIKSINERGFKEVLSKGPKLEHIWQANIYCKALKLPRMVFIYENKNDQKWYEKSVNFQPNLWQEVVDKIKMIEEWRAEYRKTGKIPAGVHKAAAETARNRMPWGIYAADLLRPRLGEKTLESRQKMIQNNVTKLLRRK